ncbi:hypothetical protein OC834_005063 [Tilletia horrida]|uniref:Uncharacterized protein n=1 Tax=Tilletia horrida TaxID=155126 RepID=A0AAN6GIC9_9BASI|nr:hypothetical protein OC834_005063 [Tilletia horrida]KAK0531057.1 hypothetical protein OC835_003810 [Tilletia horrida]KAK0535619.1 hypothetical protein OC842_002254 [Tilletia horrida]KAK0543423.1 hypothetical protein OC844_007608 [Tilletia horrida]
MFSKSLVALAVLLPASVLAKVDPQHMFKPTFTVDKLPDKWEKGQVGTNQCNKWLPDNKDSMCQNVFFNSLHDFCLFGPIKHHGAAVGEEEKNMVAYCLKSGYGTRLIPDGTIKQAHFIRAKSFMQVTGYGDFTKIGIKAKDDGGELDSHGADGYGNPAGGLVFSRSIPGTNHKWTQMHEWASFMSATEFSFRACFDTAPEKLRLCPHQYDEMGARFSHPGNYGEGFDQCDSDDGHFPGWYRKTVTVSGTKSFSSSFFWQGDAHTPKPHKPGKTSECKTYKTVHNGPAKVLPTARAEVPEQAPASGKRAHHFGGHH